MADKSKLSVVDENKKPALTVALLAWPVFLEQILVSLVGYMDTAMVGSLGKNATAAVSISNAPMFLVNGVIMALGVGFTALISRAVGADEIERAKKLMRQAIFAVVMLGVPISIGFFSLARQIPAWMGGAPEILDDAATYNRIIAVGLVFRTLSMILTSLYRGYGDTKTPLVANMAVNIINVVGNFLLIFETREITLAGASFTMPGAGWGVAGAAVATSGSAIVGALILLMVTFLRPGPMKLSIRGDYRPDREIFKSVGKISVPAALERITMSLASILTTSTIATLGTAAVAANSLALTAESISFMPGFALGTAATTLVGQSLGAKRADLAQKYVRTTVIISAAMMLVFGTLLYIFATQLVGLFTPDEEVIELGAVCLRISAYIQIPQVIASVLSGGMRGAGDTKWTFFIISGAMWLIRIPMTLIGIRVLGYGLDFAYYAMNADICARCIGYYLRYRTGRWKDVIRD